MIRSIVTLMRPGDWVKNAFILLAPIFALPAIFASGAPAGGVFLDVVVNTAIAIVAFAAISSGFYCINDALDVAIDRQHPVKCQRPVATGAIPAGAAVVLGLILIVVSLGIAALDNSDLVMTLGLYALVQLLYNLGLKRVMLVDVVMVAIGFGLRAAAGAVAIQVQVSIWMILCVFFLCLFLAFTKRLFDMSSAEAAGVDWKAPAGYQDRNELNWLLGVSAVLAIMTYVMYTLSPHAISIFGPRAVGLALLTPLVFIAMHRFYQRAMQGRSDSPLDALIEDRAVLVSIVVFAVGTIVTLYVPAVAELLTSLFYADGSSG
jgi:4-hydroxybenzoate polyprenyltransferase